MRLLCCSSVYLRDLSDWLGCDPSLKLLLPLRRRMSGKGALDKDLSRLLLRVTFSLIYIVDLFLGSGLLSSFLQVMPNLLLESGKDDVSTGVETDCQPAGIASCGLQSDVSEVVHSRSRNWELMEQAFDDDNIHVQMRNLPVLFLIVSWFHLIFASYIDLSPILLPLLCMPLGIRLFICVAPSVRWKRLSCWIR